MKYIWPDLNPVDYSVWEKLQAKVFKIHITDLDELKQRLRTEWAKLDHVVIAAGSHSSVASAIGPDHLCVFVQYSPYAVINWI